MPPKRHVFDAPESAAAKWRRLCPGWAPPTSLNLRGETGPVAASETQVDAAATRSVNNAMVPQRGSTRWAASSSSTAAAYVNPPPGRTDAPVVRHVRRGTTAAAVAALATFGSIALVEALLQDRYAKSASSTTATLAPTWQYFHDQAFAHADPPVPYLPITVRTLVMVGSLFKAAGYRSYPNYISAMKSQHIEAEHEWGQLLTHTSGWVTRSVLRGIGPARQSCAFLFNKLAQLTCVPETLVPMGMATRSLSRCWRLSSCYARSRPARREFPRGPSTMRPRN